MLAKLNVKSKSKVLIKKLNLHSIKIFLQLYKIKTDKLTCVEVTLYKIIIINYIFVHIIILVFILIKYS